MDASASAVNGSDFSKEYSTDSTTTTRFDALKNAIGGDSGEYFDLFKKEK